MVIQPKYSGAAEGAIASYDWTDIASRTGKEVYYIATGLNGATTNYNLTNFKVFSHSIKLSQAYNSAGTAFELDIEKDFDLEFGQPRNIKGDFFGNLMISTADTGGSYGTSVKTTTKLRKWDGTTETEILSIDAEGGGAGAGATVSTIFGISGTFPLTHFKAGETLRITIMIYTKSTSGTASTTDGNIYLGSDPNNRTDALFATTGHNRTDTQFVIPFRIDI